MKPAPATGGKVDALPPRLDFGSDDDFQLKQAMNHLLHQLEPGGYLRRESHPDDRRTRVVRLTDRGWAAARVIAQAMDRLDERWCRALGRESYAALAQGLVQLQELFESQLTVR